MAIKPFIIQTKKIALQHLKQVLIDFLQERLGSDFTPEVAEAWTKTLDLVYKSIFKGYDA